VEITKGGFAKYVQSGIVLQVGSNSTLDVSLRVGALTESVQVEANASQVETQATGVGQVIDNTRVLELPLNARNSQQLIMLAGAAVAGGQLYRPISARSEPLVSFLASARILVSRLVRRPRRVRVGPSGRLRRNISRTC